MNMQPHVQNIGEDVPHEFLIFGGIDDDKQEMKTTANLTVYSYD